MRGALGWSKKGVSNPTTIKLARNDASPMTAISSLRIWGGPPGLREHFPGISVGVHAWGSDVEKSLKGKNRGGAFRPHTRGKKATYWKEKGKDLDHKNQQETSGQRSHPYFPANRPLFSERGHKGKFTRKKSK